MIYYISQNKDIEEKLRAHINQVIKSDIDITKDNLKKLTYIDWIQNETCRLYGPGFSNFPKIALRDHFISNVPIKKGTILNINLLCSSYDQNNYKNPK